MAKDIKGKNEPIFGNWEYRRTNYLMFLGGITVILIGYLVMATGETTSFQSITLAPIMLLIGYLVLIPLAILYRPNMFQPKDKPDT